MSERPELIEQVRAELRRLGNNRVRESIDRFFTPEQRIAIAKGADVFVSMSTYGAAPMPLELSIEHPDEKPTIQ